MLFKGNDALTNVIFEARNHLSNSRCFRYILYINACTHFFVILFVLFSFSETAEGGDCDQQERGGVAGSRRAAALSPVRAERCQGKEE